MSFDFNSRCCSNGTGLESIQLLTLLQCGIIAKGQGPGQRKYILGGRTATTQMLWGPTVVGVSGEVL